MKNIFLFVLIVIAALFMNSCREIKVNTIVNKDGTFTRIITVTGDSSDLYKPGLPYPIDETWITEIKKDTTNEKHYILTYTKNFENSKALNHELISDTSWKKNLKRSVDIEKSFGFFYSYINYREVIVASNPFTELNYKDYLTKDDMMWLTGKKLALNKSDSARIEEVEDKAEEYLQESFTAEIAELLRSGISELNISDLKPDLVDKYYDSISDKVSQWDYNHAYEFVDYFSKIADNKDLEMIKQKKSNQLKAIDKNVEILYHIFEMEDYSTSVELPGILTNTSSKIVINNTVKWNVTNMSFLFDDFTMSAESRVVNVWMFVIAGVVVLLLLVLLLMRLFR